MKTKLKNEKGFTIIEVLIVLAIAGLILLIVFLAVPALQRNSRNTQRREDIAKILGAISEFSNNNNGAMPNGAWTNAGGTLNVIGAAGTIPSQAQVGYYNLGMTANTAGNITKLGNDTDSPAGTLSSTLSNDWVRISTAQVCNGVASESGSARSATAVFQIETGNNAYAQQCTAS